MRFIFAQNFRTN